MKQSHTLFLIPIFVFFVSSIGFFIQPEETKGAASPKQIVTEVVGSQYLIYVEETETHTKTLVKTLTMGDIHPLFKVMMSLSPNGEYLLYVTAESTALDNANVVIVTTDGQSEEIIASFPTDLWTVAPVWSPDSRQLALVRQEPANAENGDVGLWILDVGTKALTEVITDKTFQSGIFLYQSEGVLRWSANGNAVQYTDRFIDTPTVYEIDLETKIQRSWEAPKEELAEYQPLSTSALPCSVPIFNQRSYNNNMQSCNQTIKNAGCALTSVTMVAKYYGVNIDPPTMNSRLGNSACPIVWGRVDDGDVTGGKINITRTKETFSYTRLQEDLNNGRPPIVWVTKGCSGSNGTHFVVVTDGSGTNPASYTINDPGDGNTRTLGYYTSNGYCLREIDTYSGTPACSDGDGGDISYGQSKTGSISPARDKDNFYFNGTAGETITVRMNKSGSSLDSYVILYKPNGSFLKSNDDSGGNRNALLTVTLPTTGRYKIVAKGYSTSTGAYSLQLTKEAATDPDDGRWIAIGRTLGGTISPTNDRDVYYFSGSARTVVSIRMNKSGSSTVDSYLELYNAGGSRIAVNDDGGGNQNSWLVKELPANGTYRIVARSWRQQSSGSYTISLSRANSTNLALNRPARATSVEYRGVEAYKAFDGRSNTRWSSAFRDPQLIYVDLGSNKTFNKVILRWEAAYARKYGIYVWTGSQWRPLYWTNYGNGGLDTITFSAATGRYVAMYGVQRGTNWGYSLWDFEIYNTANLLMPLVPPDPGGKEVDDIEPLAPLGPNDEGKEEFLVGEDEDAQEDFPLAEESSEAVSSEFGDTGIPYAEIISPSELDSFYTEADTLRFEGYGIDNDEDGENIVAYNWRSSLDGEIGTEAMFTIPLQSLSNGTHTIFLKVQDNEGDWSEEATIILEVNNKTRVYLPIIVSE